MVCSVIVVLRLYGVLNRCLNAYEKPLYGVEGI